MCRSASTARHRFSSSGWASISIQREAGRPSQEGSILVIFLPRPKVSGPFINHRFHPHDRRNPGSLWLPAEGHRVTVAPLAVRSAVPRRWPAQELRGRIRGRRKCPKVGGGIRVHRGHCHPSSEAAPSARQVRPVYSCARRVARSLNGLPTIWKVLLMDHKLRWLAPQVPL
jgi:hypothetical protein